MTAEKEKHHVFEPNKPIEEKEEVLQDELPWAGIHNPTMETILEQQAIIESLRKEYAQLKTEIIGLSGLRHEEKENIEAVNILDFINDKIPENVMKHT